MQKTTLGGFPPLTDSAVRLGVSYRTLANMIRRGDIAAAYTGEKRQRARFISVDEIERYERERAARAAAAAGVPLDGYDTRVIRAKGLKG